MIQEIEIDKIKVNTSNPRVIKDDKFKKLVESIKNFPEMLKVRPIVVNTDMIILGGNMRYRACIDAGLKTVWVDIVDWSEDKQREFVIKDNLDFGEWSWDELANGWDSEKLGEWGLDVPVDVETPSTDGEQFEIKGVLRVFVDCVDENQQEKLFSELVSLGYEPKVINV